MKKLLIDVETTPNIAHVWGLWQNNVSLNQLMDSSYMMCFAAKWYGQRQAEFRSVHRDGKDVMLKRAHDLMSEADAIIHFNGKRFDIPVLNKEFLLAGMLPPAPSKQIDLFQVVKRNFRFPSNKLQYVAQTLGLEGKTQHEGHTLWVKCMAGEAAAWKLMEKYNKQDVHLLGDVYDILLPWISNHPNVALYNDLADCPRCGGLDLRKEGFAHTAAGKFQRYQCKDCGSWSRTSRRSEGVEFHGVVL